MALANGDSVALTRFAAKASDDGAPEARAGAAFYEFRHDEVIPGDHLSRVCHGFWSEMPRQKHWRCGDFDWQSGHMGLNNRTFSIAITAWSTKVVSSSICWAVNGAPSVFNRVIVPSGTPSRRRCMANTVRKPVRSPLLENHTPGPPEHREFWTGRRSNRERPPRRPHPLRARLRRRSQRRVLPSCSRARLLSEARRTLRHISRAAACGCEELAAKRGQKYFRLSRGPITRTLWCDCCCPVHAEGS